ncbi:MAG: SIS domain-containing protein [Anaerolineae bacterium]
MGLIDEIREQPNVLQNWLDTRLATAHEIAQTIRARQPKFVLLAGRGTSDHAGVYAQYVWGSLNRIPVALAAPSLFSCYGQVPALQDGLVVGLSQSGKSPDIVSVLEEGRRQNALTLAITNDPQSPLAQTADMVLPLQAGVEKAVAATKTYTAELMAVAAIAAAWSDAPEHIAELSRVPEAARQALEQDAAAGAIAAGHAALKQCIVLGRGYNYATALEWALKLKELTYVFADAYSTVDFQHGPIAIAEPGLPVFAIANQGPVLSDLLALLTVLRDQHHAELVVIADNPQAQALSQRTLRIPPGLPEWLTPLVSIIPGQLYCYHLTQARGHNTEAPRTIQKVTLTR